LFDGKNRSFRFRLGRIFKGLIIHRRQQKPGAGGADVRVRVSSMSQNSSVRRGMLWVLSVIIAFFGTMAIYRYFTRPPKYQAKYQTVAHRFLDLEAKYVTIPDESYELLDDLITAVKSTTKYDATITNRAEREKQFLRIFNRIDSVLVQNNFIFPPGEWNCTLGEALDDHPLSSKEMEVALTKPHNARREAQMKSHAGENFHLIACVNGAFLYMGVAEALGFELKPVLAPKHMFVRAQLDRDHWINWDTNRARSISDKDYVSGWGVEDWQIRQKIYMQSLSADEIDAEMYTAVGVDLGDHAEFRGFDPAIECYRKAIALNPREVYAYCNLTQSLLFKPDPDSAARTESMELAHRAVELQPNEAATHLSLAYALAADGQTATAVAEINRAIEVDPENTNGRAMLPLIQSGYTMYGAFKSSSPMLYAIEYEHGWIYIPIIGIWIVMGIAIFRILLRTGRKLSSESATIPVLAATGQ
jgi:tetratricopeptide (TPR) repeat protein